MPGVQAQNILGRTVQPLIFLDALRRGNLQGALLNQIAAQQDPAARASLRESPFLAGTLGLGTEEIPVQGPLLPGAERETVRQVDLPELSPEAMAERLRSNLLARLTGVAAEGPLPTSREAQVALGVRPRTSVDLLPPGTSFAPITPGSRLVGATLPSGDVRVVGTEPLPRLNPATGFDVLLDLLGQRGNEFAVGGSVGPTGTRLNIRERLTSPTERRAAFKRLGKLIEQLEPDFFGSNFTTERQLEFNELMRQLGFRHPVSGTLVDASDVIDPASGKFDRERFNVFSSNMLPETELP